MMGVFVCCCIACVAGQELQQQLDKVLEAHRAAAEALVKQELQNACGNSKLGFETGTCSNSDSSSDGSSSGETGEVCGEGEEKTHRDEMEGKGSCSSDSSSSSSVGSQEGGREAAAIEASHKDSEGGGDRGSSADNSGGSNGSGSGQASTFLGALKARVLGGSGAGSNSSSKDPEMKVGVVATHFGKGWGCVSSTVG
jgi:hypothetical protein